MRPGQAERNRQCVWMNTAEAAKQLRTACRKAALLDQATRETVVWLPDMLTRLDRITAQLRQLEDARRTE